MRWLAAVAAISTALVVVPGQHSAAAPVAAPAFSDLSVATVPLPTAVEPLDGGRVVVLEQDSGRIRIIDTASGQLLAAPRSPTRRVHRW